MKVRMANTNWLKFTLIWLFLSSGLAENQTAKSLEWTIVDPPKNETGSRKSEDPNLEQKQNRPLSWRRVSSKTSQTLSETSHPEIVTESTEADNGPVDSVIWQAVDPNDVINTEGIASDDSDDSSQIAASPMPLPVTGGMFQVKRADQWLPSITQRIPNGFGGSFGDFQTGLWLADCSVSGGYVCGNGTKDWVTEFQDTSENDWISQISLGDPTKWLGIDLGLTISSLATRRPNATSDGTPFGSGQGLHLALSRNITPDIGIKLGAFNLVELDKVQYDAGKSAYGVVSARIDLGGNLEENTNDLYLTLGAANGIFRPLNAIIEDQGRECNNMRKKQDGHLSSYGYGLYCNMWGLDYGTLWPVGSIAYLVNPKFSFFGEWWGRNLTIGFSLKPFDEINWVITPGISSVIQNSDWNSQYPGYTERMRLQLTTSIGF